MRLYYLFFYASNLLSTTDEDDGHDIEKIVYQFSYGIVLLFIFIATYWTRLSVHTVYLILFYFIAHFFFQTSTITKDFSAEYSESKTGADRSLIQNSLKMTDVIERKIRAHVNCKEDLRQTERRKYKQVCRTPKRLTTDRRKWNTFVMGERTSRIAETLIDWFINWRTFYFSKNIPFIISVIWIDLTSLFVEMFQHYLL